MAGRLKVWNASTSTWDYVSGPGTGPAEMDYAQNTVGHTVTATVESIVTGNSVTYDGVTEVWIEFYAPYISCDTTTAGTEVSIYLYDNGVQVSRLSVRFTQVAGRNNHDPQFLSIKRTPTAGAHTFSIRAAGLGYIGADSPIFMRITRRQSDASRVGSGTAFPASPVTGDTFYRTDLRALFQWSGTVWLFPRGYEIAYAEKTSATSITATSGSGNLVVAAPSAVYDGGPVLVEAFSPIVRPDSVAAGNYMTLSLYDATPGATIGLFGSVQTPAAAIMYTPFYAVFRTTLSAGTHVLQLAAIVGSGTGNVGGGVAGAGAYIPCFIRVTKAA